MYLGQPTYATHDIDNPVMACNRNHTSEFVPDVINVPSGARIGTFWWGHVIGTCFYRSVRLSKCSRLVQISMKKKAFSEIQLLKDTGVL
jgi:hypothetical protein